jgi:3-deoxy-manno-octulosonate cytidylyltransferase (CMP-KDO synthetase)
MHASFQAAAVMFPHARSRTPLATQPVFGYIIPVPRRGFFLPPSIQSPAAAIVIPARYASTRFPGKPLAKQTGKFLIQHCVEQAQKARRADVAIVATDDNRIFDAVRSFGGHAVMTSNAHQSGTDRIAEVIRKPEYASVKFIVNVQGDEPDIDPELIDSLLEVLSKHDDLPMATVATPFAHSKDIESPNLVKVVTDHRHCAIYFSRAEIPYDRDRHTNGAPLGAGPGGPYRRHLGIYAYRREALLTLSSTPVCELERLEKLEQLRALYLGMKIYVQETAHAPHGVDTPEDYAAFVKRYHHGNGHAHH